MFKRYGPLPYVLKNNGCFRGHSVICHGTLNSEQTCGWTDDGGEYMHLHLFQSISERPKDILQNRFVSLIFETDRPGSIPAFP